MNVVPQNAPPMLLPPTAEHAVPSYAQSARPFPPLNPQTVPELPWRVKEKAKAKAKGKEKAKEKEKRTRALTAEAEQQSEYTYTCITEGSKVSVLTIILA